MKTRLLCLGIISVLMTSITNAQTARLEGGLNLANVSITDNGRVNDAKMLTSFHAGIRGDIPLGNIFSFQPGLFFTGKGTKSKSGDESSVTYYKATTNPYYVELPLNFVFKIADAKGSRFFAGAGPYLAVGVSGKNKVEGKYLGIAFSGEEDIRFSDDDPTTLDYEEGAGFGILKRFDYGLNGTAGLEGKSMTLALNYGFGLSKLQSGGNSSSDNNNKHRVLSVSLGFKL
jgi:hypothetical protein